MKKIGIIVPCYNEEKSIIPFLDKMEDVLDDIKTKGYTENFFYIFINDGSVDKTLEVIKNAEKSKKYKHEIKYISFSKNFWKEAGMLAGLNKAKAEKSDACIFMDVDLQDPPELIEEMLEKWHESYKYIYTKHKHRNGESKIKKFFALSFYRVYTFFTKDKKIVNGARDFALLDSVVMDAFLSIKDEKRFSKGIASYVGFKRYCIEFEYVPRTTGKSKMNFKRLFKYAFTGINNFSNFLFLIPIIALIASLIVFAVDLIVLITNGCSFGNIFFNDCIRLDLLSILLTSVLWGLFKLNYDIKHQVLERPQYIIEEEN